MTEPKKSYLMEIIVALLVTIVGGVIVANYEHYQFDDETIEVPPKPNGIQIDTSNSSPTSFNTEESNTDADNNTTNSSCILNSLQNINNESKINVHVNLNNKYSESFTLLLIEMLKNKFPDLFLNKEVIVVASRNENPNLFSAKDFLLAIYIKTSFKPTNKTTSIPELSQSNLITGEATGNYSLFNTSNKNMLVDCPIFKTFPGMNEQKITHQLLKVVFKNI